MLSNQYQISAGDMAANLQKLPIDGNNNNNNNGNNMPTKQPTQPPPNRLAIGWLDLTFYGRSLLSMCRQPKTILNEISGTIDFGTLVALMGPSGAGKSTLLKCINGRTKSGVGKSSTIYLSSSRPIRSCFIVQDVTEHLLMGLTTMQSLVYSSKLKNVDQEGSGGGGRVDHRLNARRMLADLMIGDTADTYVQNCSGGEQKRLAIALELMAINKPNLMCIDEPTSGLDSNAAEIVVQVLKNVSRKHNMAIVTSIHQPNSDVLMLFDQLYVLGKGGLCVYEGPPNQLRDHLSRSEFECTEHQVPIELLLKIASKPDHNLQRLANQTVKSRQSLRNKCLIEGQLAPNGIEPKTPGFNISQTWYLFQRTAAYSFKSQWKAMVGQFVCIVGLSYILTTIYNKNIGQPDGCFALIDNDLSANDGNSSGVTTTVGCDKTVEVLKVEYLLSQNLRFTFFAGLMIQFLLTVGTTLIFATEVKIFINEHKNGWYSTGSYYWAKSIVELPLNLIIALFYVIILYRLSNQIDEQNRFVGYLIVITAGALCSQGLGFTIGIVANTNDKLAIVLSVGTYLTYIMLCGFFAPIDELPESIRWITHGSYVKQTFEMQLFLIYGFDRCPQGLESSILYQNNLRESDKFWRNALILAIHTVSFRLTALLALLSKANTFSLTGFRRSTSSSRTTRTDKLFSETPVQEINNYM
ncbi:ATP-binding cassette sub-family G member 1-like [Oppia nitens]|uniref:ATP-binding cassette sub-family G member 1-like n=1 Tax=Oppia nitens TaxID=1686743 RepID=UPI0023D98BF5|nr:ATP-binding cassette sub-family G member 1-like [Oppia nitens]